MKTKIATSIKNPAEDLFVQLFCEAFGPDKADNLYVQHPFVDIYGKHRYIDFALENEEMRIALEVDGETYHNPTKVSENKYFDDLLKQNSLVYQEWKVYRWAYNEIKNHPERVKDELVTFLGETPFLKAMQEFLPNQEGRVIELRDYQQSAIDNLQEMRDTGEKIALLYHATGVGKTITAATDAKVVGGRTLFLVNALKLATQAEEAFQQIWPEASRGQYTGSEKNGTEDIVFATIQTLSRHLTEFKPQEFDYLIIDECHHAGAKTYKKILGYFKPQFVLGLSATPERTDGQDMLKLFQNVAHKMGLKEAVESGILVPIRCVRVKTNVDLTDVRFHGIKYNMQDLESKLFIPERNTLIADTYCQYVSGRKTVIFCASVDHATEIAKLLRERDVKAFAVSGRDDIRSRNKILHDYEHGDIDVLCACDLLNEGWDSPHTEVLFMARPTMSKTIYMQQLGRGTRKCEGKEDLLVFDFIDNANLFNMPYSTHRVLGMGKYKPFERVLGPKKKKKLDQDMLYVGEKSEAYVTYPISAMDYETIDLFNWQDEAKGMKSQLEFVRMVDIQAETIEKYIRDDKIKPDMIIPIGEKRNFYYFYEDTIKMYAKQFSWDLITPANITSKFIEFVEKMTMSYSYKPVFLKAFFSVCNDKGKAHIGDIVNYVTDYYETRRDQGLIVEKAKSIYAKGGYTEKDVERNIYSNPFKRFEDMRFMKHSREIDEIEINSHIFKHLDDEKIADILAICDKKLDEYFARLESK